MTGDDARWAALFPDEEDRLRWRGLFAFRGPALAADFRDAFNGDYETAEAWSRRWNLTAAEAGYLHRHGYTAATAPIRTADLTVEADDGRRDGHSTRVCLHLTHPHLTKADRDAIIAARITLDEADHLITTGTYDRATLTFLGAFT